MKSVLPPPLTAPPAEQSLAQDFMLILKSQIRVAWNKMRHRSAGTLIIMALFFFGILSLLVFLGNLSYGALKMMPPQAVQLFLSFLLMTGLAGQIFFGITAAFAALYMSEDLELLFMAPVSTKVIFAVKSMSVFGSTFFIAFLFAFLPGIFYGLLFNAEASYYVLVILVGLGLWVIGTALAEFINLLVMRIVPPHRSKEAIGLIGALSGILIALVFQIPNLLSNSRTGIQVGDWLAAQTNILSVMNFFPWGWGALALVDGMTGSFLTGLSWSLLLLAFGVLLFLLSFTFIERGFRQGFISLSQGRSGKRRKKQPSKAMSDKHRQAKYASSFLKESVSNSASPWRGMWAVAKKDLLSIKRDTREWFGYLAPLIILIFFVAQYLFLQEDASRASLIAVLVMYTVMFSGNLALQSFGREGESEWLLNSVPLAGWPIVWGKLLAAILPTLILMEALLVGTALAIGLSTTITVAMAFGAILLSLGSSAIGLFYSINNCRYNPDAPQQRISPSASLLMYVINLFYIGLLALGIVYLVGPTELITVLETLPPVTFEGGFLSAIAYGFYLLTRPFFWPEIWRILLGIIVTGGIWCAMFFGFMAATVRQSRKGFRVELVRRKK